MPLGSDRGLKVTSVPTFSLVIPAYNEEQSIESKIRNVLTADYPRELLDVLVVSDASTDRTNDRARSFATQGVRLIVQEERRDPGVFQVVLRLDEPEGDGIDKQGAPQRDLGGGECCHRGIVVDV